MNYIGEFPWTIGILREDYYSGDTLKLYQCDASLIHPSVVVTVAHCIYGIEPSSLYIRAGEWDIQTKNESLPHQERVVADYVLHSNYSHLDGQYNDIALLFLDEPVQFADNVNTICLPPEHFTAQDNNCLASGWVHSFFDNTENYQTILKHRKLDVVSHDKCLSDLRKIGNNITLHESIFCGGTAQQRTGMCKGDGGSPLVCPITTNQPDYYLAGIFTGRFACEDEHISSKLIFIFSCMFFSCCYFPFCVDTFVNISLYRPWIDDQIKLRKFVL